MKITSFAINKYGPLIETGLISLGNFNLFWGENEDGKTLTQEAIIRMLIGSERKLFPGIDRVAESPDGYLILEKQNGEEIKVPEQGLVTDILGVSVKEYRNLFIIRNSDLSIARETDFYGDITERLTGLRTRQITKIKSRLRQLGYFTEKLDVINTRDSHYLKNRLEEASALIKQCDSLLEKAETKKYDDAETMLARLQKQYQGLEAECNALQGARLREKFEAGHTHLSELTKSLQKIKPLKVYTDEGYNEWRNTAALIVEKSEEKKSLEQQATAAEKDLTEAENNLQNFRHRFSGSDAKNKDVDTFLSPLLNKWQALNELLAANSIQKTLITVALILSFAVAAAAFSGMAFRPAYPHWNDIAVGATMMAVIFSLFYYYSQLKPGNEMRRLGKQIRERAEKMGFTGKKTEDILEQVERFEETLQRQKQNVTSGGAQVAYLQKNLDELKDNRLVALDQKITEANKVIAGLKTAADVTTLEDYYTRLKLKKQYDQKIKDAFAVLRSLFKARGNTIQECIPFWQDEIDQLERYQSSAATVKFDEKLLAQKRAEQNILQDDINHLSEQVVIFHEQMGELEKQAGKVLQDVNEDFTCGTIQEVQKLREKLQEFQASVARRQKNVRIALDIFQEIEDSEREKVGVLFGEDSNISRFYRKITDGLYENVLFDNNTVGLKVGRRDGKYLSPELLSSGAYDQLYFSVRLTLGEKLLPKEKGFFILDDPFLKSDRERLKRQLAVLVDVAERGWQIIYFSAKDEVKDALQEYIDTGRVRLHRMTGIEFKSDVSPQI